jgi:hypothetical protein
MLESQQAYIEIYRYIYLTDAHSGPGVCRGEPEIRRGSKSVPYLYY